MSENGNNKSSTATALTILPLRRAQDTLFGEERAGYLSALSQNEAMVGQEQSLRQKGGATEGRKSQG